MQLPHPSVLGGVYALSEIILAVRRRSPDTKTESHDRNSLQLLWVVIVSGVVLGLILRTYCPEATLPHAYGFALLGLALFFIGIALRWYAIYYLGRFFTVDVSISEGHTVIDAGPYRFIRHPSYTGALIAFLGFGLFLGNWVSLLVMVLPILIALLWRIHVEENALLQALGDSYRDYMRRTKCLIPFIY